MTEGGDRQALFDHWLDVHVPNVREVMGKIGGFRYVVSHSLEPDTEPYAGMAELYFPNEKGWDDYRAVFEPDDGDFIDKEGTMRFHSGTDDGLYRIVTLPQPARRPTRLDNPKHRRSA